MSEGKSPWGSSGGNSGGNNGGRRPPRRPQQQAPDLDNVIRGFKDKFGGGSGGSGGGKGNGLGGIPLLIAIGAVLLVGKSTFFTIDQQEEAVVLRFGEYQRTVAAGLNFKFPTPIETYIKEKTREIKQINIGNNVKQSEMLTGDENIVEINFSVLWRINNLEEYLFEVNDPEKAVQ
ncbi:MAG: peptidase, partial [Robiginitomaculum sp.]|nr:peptidase [Robiginitomaculum sp.]